MDSSIKPEIPALTHCMSHIFPWYPVEQLASFVSIMMWMWNQFPWSPTKSGLLTEWPKVGWECTTEIPHSTHSMSYKQSHITQCICSLASTQTKCWVQPDGSSVVLAVISAIQTNTHSWTKSLSNVSTASQHLSIALLAYSHNLMHQYYIYWIHGLTMLIYNDELIKINSNLLHEWDFC